MNLIYGMAALPMWLSGLLLVGVPTLLALCGPPLVRRFVPLGSLADNNEVAGFQFATLGVVYAVMLGLAVISVWEKFADAQAATASEAAALVSMYRLADGVDAGSRQAIHAALDGYVKSAIADDWPAMEHGEPSEKTLAALGAVYAAILALRGEERRDAVILAELLNQLDGVTEARRERLHLAEGIVPGVIWAVLFVGAVMTLGFTLFFGLRSLRVQVLMTGMLALVIFLALFVGLLIDHPFSGSVHVQPSSLLRVLHDFAAP